MRMLYSLNTVVTAIVRDYFKFCFATKIAISFASFPLYGLYEHESFETQSFEDFS